jgi:hypothetical protein
VFHRSSQNRVYTHVVIGRRCKDNAMTVAKGASWAAADGRNWDYSNDKVLGRKTWYAFESEQSREADRARVAEGRDNYIERKRAERIVKVSETDFTKWSVLGWASRPDLAEKNASSHRAKSYWAEVQILEAKII